MTQRILSNNCRRGGTAGWVGMLAVALVAGQVSMGAQGVPEPDTLLYGQVLNWSGSRPSVLTNGTLSWQVRHGARPGDLLFLATSLRAIGTNPWSYRLALPHAAAMPGAPFNVAGFIPLGPEATVLHHGEIRVDGWPARIVGPQGGRVAVSQQQRAGTHRLDLQVSYPLPDTDRDGLPDWWEARYGLGDAGADSDGDGRSNLQEYEDGTDPKAADNHPRILTRSASLYANSSGGLILQSADGDSTADQRIYTLGQLPDGIEVRLVAGNVAEGPLTSGATFSQTDANQGRLRLVHLRGEGPFLLPLTLRDEVPEHPSNEVAIEVQILRPIGVAPETALWLDAAGRTTAATPAPAERLATDLSGNGRGGEWVPAPASAGATNASGDLQAARLTGQFLVFTQSPETGLEGRDAVTAFAAFRTESSASQQVLADGRLGIRLLPKGTGTAAQIEFQSGDRRVRSQAPLGDGWTVVSGWRDGVRAGLEINGRGTGSVAEADPESSEYVRPGLGARSLGKFDLETGRWVFTETNAFQGAVGEIAVFPGTLPADQRRRLGYALLGKWAGHIFWDASTQGQPVRLRVAQNETNRTAYAQGTARDRSHILLGTPGPDILEGGMESDILDGGLGGDSLTGHGGADAFVFLEPDAAIKRIQDFRPDEGDVLDLSGLLTGSSMDLDDYIQVHRSGTNTLFRISAAGAGTGFTNLVIECVNRVWRQPDLQVLWADGALRLGARRILPDAESGPVRVHVRTEAAAASEEGPRAGLFVLRRTGLAEEPLTVAVFLGGTARNGVDYSYVPVSALFPAGVRELPLRIEPLADDDVEPPEAVELSVLPGAGYELGDSGPARIRIEDLPLYVSIEAMDQTLDLSGNGLARLVVRRDGALGQHTLVRLRFAGDAVPGSDYVKPPEYLEFAPGQAEALVSIRSGSKQLLGTRTLEVRVDAPAGVTYRIGGQGKASVAVIGGGETFLQWCARWFQEPPETAELSEDQDDDGDGIPRVHEFAFGLNPTRVETEAARDRLPHWGLGDGDRPELLVRIAPGALGLVVEVFGSSDFREWRPLIPEAREPGVWRVRSGADEQPDPWFVRFLIRTKP